MQQRILRSNEKRLRQKLRGKPRQRRKLLPTRNPRHNVSQNVRPSMLADSQKKMRTAVTRMKLREENVFEELNKNQI
jgi:hypothetical protein